MQFVTQKTNNEPLPGSAAVPGDQKPYFEAIQWLAKHYSKPCVRAAVERGLPEDYATRGREILPRLLSVIGF